jgi:hypothetical protein
MNSKHTRKGITALLAAVIVVSVLAMAASASISPDTFEAELSPCESITVNKTVEIPELPPRGDVIFAFDLTGSMGGIINTAKSNATDIMDCVDALGVDVNYGVMSYMDYPHSYDSCGYSPSSPYGGGSDYAYSLDQSVTSNRTAVNDSITALSLGWGGDGPQDYTRIFYESYADADNISYRSGAKKILVNFGDNVPHDCDLNKGVPGKTGVWTTGGDPGRDEVMNTSDDLDLQVVLSNMNDSGVILIECHSTTSRKEYWDHWTNITGGNVSITGSATLVDDVCNAIKDALVVPTVYGLHLEASSGFESWVSTVPANYSELDPGDIVTFVETIHVPDGTAPGVYTFTVSAVDDKGVSYGDQNVTITVTPSNEPPVANAGDDMTVEQDSLGGASVTLNGSRSTDDGKIAPLTYTWTWAGGSATGVSPTVSLPMGTTTVTLTVYDGEYSDTDTVDITVVDTTDPEISVTVSPDMLWPPNHKMVDIVATVTVSDIIGTEDYEFQLRAERAGKGDGRVYTITYTATDASGNSANASATVVVPHDMD